MKVSNIKSNGSGNNAAARSSFPTILTAISLYKMRFSEEDIISKFPEDSEYHIGTRFNDNETIAYRIGSALVREATLELRTEDPIILEGYIKAFVDSLSGSEMDIIITDGLRDCAGADHWYTFEKEW